MLENIISGVAANCFFLLFIAFLSLLSWMCFYGKKLLDATRFFGVGLDNDVFVYISAHADSETRTQRVITAEEFETVIESYDVLASQFQSNRFYELTTSIFQLLQFRVRIPDFIVKASPLNEVTTQRTENSLILVGGPTRNQVSKYYLENSNSWLTFDTAGEKFLINRGGRKGEELDHSGKMAILSKVILGNSVVFIIFGFGELETKSALNYFVHNWRNLYTEFDEDEFGICFIIDDEGDALVHLKLTDNT